MAFNIKPNGNIDYATGLESEQYDEVMANQPWRKHPGALPLAIPRTEQHRYVPVSVCIHEPCRSKNVIGQSVRHGAMCNGDSPLWECRLVLRLLSPGLLMHKLSTKCRTVILASGSLAPLQSLCAELNLYPPKGATESTPKKQPLVQQPSQTVASCVPFEYVDLCSPLSRSTPTTPSRLSKSQRESIHEKIGRLQVNPNPLEADHVVDLQKQLFACAIGHFPDGKPLTVNYANYRDESFFPRLGHALVTVIDSIPTGGVLVFVPSYSFLNKCIKCWNPAAEHSNDVKRSQFPQIWDRLVHSKGKVITEPLGSQERFEASRDEYKEQIRLTKSCILLAVFRGKMSEGISFNDDHARAVICIGIPFPNSFDRNIKAKKVYNDEQRKIRNNTNLLPGNEWYSQQAYRAIAQALGRCIRHGADYGAVFLMDSRLCDNGSPNEGIPRCHQNLPKWMRHCVRTLSIWPNTGVGKDPILGGYRGLAQELSHFFREAPAHSKSVLEGWTLDLEKARTRSQQQTMECVFDGVSGQWKFPDTFL